MSEIKASNPDSHMLLNCPVRGPLNASALAKDGLTTTEEARRIDFIKYLLARKYPKKNIAVETVVLKGLGSSGKNKLRADVIVYEITAARAAKLPLKERLDYALLVAEIKRDASKKASGITCQLEPAMMQLPGLRVLGAYWDDTDRILFSKKLVKKKGHDSIEIIQDTLANLPPIGSIYKSKPITVDTLTIPQNIVATLSSLADVMRSNGINDEQLRYKETVKLLLTRYCDEKAAKASSDKTISLQVLPGTDPDFRERVDKLYIAASKRYSRAHSLWAPKAVSELPDSTLKGIIKVIQGLDFLSASSDSMQQVFMSFVPVLFKKSLDQYFTPLTLIKTMVDMTKIGANENIADPAMGTADFLTAAMEYCTERGDDDAFQRVFGADSDDKAYELAVINMILNKDGQANLLKTDSIANHTLWTGEMGVVLCNPPFGAKTTVSSHSVLEKYDLGHRWSYDKTTAKWIKDDVILDSQQIGILFLERCYKMLGEGGRLAIILPEGYLCTDAYGYVRQWIIDHLQVLSVVELPRRIFLKSDADLRSNIVVAKKVSSASLKDLKKKNYPIHAELVRKVGYKLGKGFPKITKRDNETGLEIRDDKNQLVLDSDFDRVRRSYDVFYKTLGSSHNSSWNGARYQDIASHPTLDMKPRRLMPRALENLAKIKAGNYVRLDDIADVIDETIDLISDVGPDKFRRLVEGQDIRAIEGIVVPQEPSRCWVISERKSRSAYKLKHHDIIIGLVRPERRNIGLLVQKYDDMVGSPGGVAVVRPKNKKVSEYPLGWIFATLRSEACRLQFWTESGGTSYGKLKLDQIREVLLPVPTKKERLDTAKKIEAWAANLESAFREWNKVGNDEDRKPILNSPIFGLENDSSFDEEDDAD